MGTHAEKAYFQRALAWYGEIMLNANLVEATSNASAVLLRQLATVGDPRLRKPYTIDPYTYAFGLNQAGISSVDRLGNLRIKRTFDALIDAYGIRQMGLPLIPDAFDPAAIQRLAERVVFYQQNRITDALLGSATFLGISRDEASLPPVRTLAPYFDLSLEELPWLDINIRLIEMSAGLIPEGIWGVVCMDAQMLESAAVVDAVANAYSSAPCAGYMLWLTGFDESLATESQIGGFRRLVQQLSGAHGKSAVINMYGGYLSILLAQDGLTGLSHGVLYGERRSLIPASGGGLPPAKYYLRSIHEEITMPELRQLSVGIDPADFRARICDCLICTRLLQGGVDNLVSQFTQTQRRPFGTTFRDYATPEVYRLARFHFLSNRSAEVTLANQSGDPSGLLDELDTAFGEFQNLLATDTRFLLRWSRALRA